MIVNIVWRCFAVCSGIQASKSKPSENLHPVQSHRSQCTANHILQRIDDEAQKAG